MRAVASTIEGPVGHAPCPSGRSSFVGTTMGWSRKGSRSGVEGVALRGGDGAKVDVAIFFFFLV